MQKRANYNNIKVTALNVKVQNKDNMGEHVIKVMPVSASGVGNYMVVIIDENMFKSTAVQGEFTREVMDAAMEEIYTLVGEYSESVQLEYANYLQAVVNTEAEEKYRSEHPEEFANSMNHEFTENGGIERVQEA